MNTMMSPDEQPTEKLGVPYEAPRVEMVLTADDLRREVLYAGTITLKTD